MSDMNIENLSDMTMNSKKLSRAVIPLLKGVIYAERQPEIWSLTLSEQAAIREYLAVLGLQLYLDEAEGYAFVCQTESGSDEASIPRLLVRRTLKLRMSVLCLLLRKRLLQHDSSGGDPRCIVSRQEIIEEMVLYLPQAKSEARMVNAVDGLIGQGIKLGFLKELKGTKERFEIMRIIRAIINADWLGDLDKRLGDYAVHASENEALYDE
jgi:hypothetical protein